eukprot:4157959-Prymnesium_polylepis.1
MRGFGELCGGMSTTWWSNKHNMHHALTNEVGYDEDIALEPALHLWEPDPKNDLRWLRKWQHVYWPLPYCAPRPPTGVCRPAAPCVVLVGRSAAALGPL